MKFSLKIIFLCLISLFTSLTFANNPGIVFIHGTNDHRFDADGGYWKRDFIDSVSHVLPNPANTLVVNCDFREYMWHEDSAGCVSTQITDFAAQHGITSFTVYTHSDGANVIRWILSQPTFDERYQQVGQLIKQVIAIAPSSGGTPLADEAINGNVFAEGVSWLLGYKTNAVKQQRIGDMIIYNNQLLFGSQNRPNLSIPFRIIVGTDVAASPMNGNSYCNGYILNAALKLTKIYLPSCADGFLSCESQTTAGDVWFYDVNRTDGYVTLSHNQSRHSCFGLDRILQFDLAYSGDSR